MSIDLAAGLAEPTFLGEGSPAAAAVESGAADETSVKDTRPAAERLTSGRYACCFGYGEHFVTCDHHQEVHHREGARS